MPTKESFLYSALNPSKHLYVGAYFKVPQAVVDGELRLLTPSDLPFELSCQIAAPSPEHNVARDVSIWFPLSHAHFFQTESLSEDIWLDLPGDPAALRVECKKCFKELMAYVRKTYRVVVTVQTGVVSYWMGPTPAASRSRVV